VISASILDLLVILLHEQDVAEDGREAFPMEHLLPEIVQRFYAWKVSVLYTAACAPQGAGLKTEANVDTGCVPFFWGSS